MKKAEEGNIVLLFMDASHFVLGCDYLGYIYSRVRRFVRTFSGRKRYNVLGAIDYVTKRILTVTNDSYITATEVCDMMRKVASEFLERPYTSSCIMQDTKSVPLFRYWQKNLELFCNIYRHIVQISI